MSPGASRGIAAADPLRRLADCAPVMLWLAGADRKCIHVNRAWLEFTGRPLQAELGFGWTEALHPEDRPRVLELYERAFHERAPFESRFRLRRSDGAWRWLDGKGSPLLHDGVLDGFVGSCADITDRVADEESRAREDARRDEFLAIVSHELRSPLNGIKSWTHVLENLLEDAPPPVRRALAGIMIGVDHQVRLIDELLDATRAMGVAKPPMALPSLEGIHVLLVDDQRETRESLAALLAQSGARVETASSGHEALRLLDASEPHDVIVCDIAMPEEDGYATLRRIRRWEEENAHRAKGHCPAVALSASTQREDRIRALSEGFQMHLTKPVAPAELVIVISNVARGLRV
jgi:PAS domain S-box-containing protein